MCLRFVVFAALAAGVLAPGWAQEGSVSGEWVNVLTRQGVRKETPYNPGNDLAMLPGGVADSTLRLNLRGRVGDMSFGLGPRLAYRETYDLHEGSSRESKTTAYLNHWHAAWRPGPYEVFYTRELMLWGPSLLASPSNPFFRNVDQTNPMIELPTRDFVGARAQLSDSDRLSLVINTGRGRDTETLRDFKRTAALQYEHTGNDYSFGTVVSRRGATVRWGGYGQYTVGDATLLYADGAWLKEPERQVVVGTPENLLLGPRGDAGKRRMDLLLGGSYTFVSGPTVNLEYRYNAAGYDAGERRALDRYAQVSAARFTGEDPMGGATALAAVVQPYSTTWGRHYAHLQYNERFSNRTSFVGLLQYGLDAKDLSVTLVLTHDVGDRLRLMANAVFYGGPSYQGTQRYMKNLLYLGAKLSF